MLVTSFKHSKIYLLTKVCFIFRFILCGSCVFMSCRMSLNIISVNSCLWKILSTEKNKILKKGPCCATESLKSQTSSLLRQHKRPPALRQGLLCKSCRLRWVSITRCSSVRVSPLLPITHSKKQSYPNNDRTSSAGGGKGNPAPAVFLLAFMWLGGHSSSLT